MKMWIARTEYGNLKLFKKKPRREVSMLSMKTYWDDGLCSFHIDSNLFPSVTFENSPQQVEIKLI